MVLGELPLMGGSHFFDDSFDGTRTSMEKEGAFWLGVVHVGLWKEKGNFWKRDYFYNQAD